MNRQEAIGSILPKKCPHCSGKQFEVRDHASFVLTDPPYCELHLECTNCHWISEGAEWQHNPFPREIVHSKALAKTWQQIEVFFSTSDPLTEAAYHQSMIADD